MTNFLTTEGWFYDKAIELNEGHSQIVQLIEMRTRTGADSIFG